MLLGHMRAAYIHSTIHVDRCAPREAFIREQMRKRLGQDADEAAATSSQMHPEDELYAVPSDLQVGQGQQGKSRQHWMLLCVSGSMHLFADDTLLQSPCECLIASMSLVGKHKILWCPCKVSVLSCCVSLNQAVVIHAPSHQCADMPRLEQLGLRVHAYQQQDDKAAPGMSVVMCVQGQSTKAQDPGAWATGIVEVALPVEYQMKNIEETEAAKRRLLHASRSAVRDRLPKVYQCHDLT